VEVSSDGALRGGWGGRLSIGRLARGGGSASRGRGGYAVDRATVGAREQKRDGGTEAGGSMGVSWWMLPGVVSAFGGGGRQRYKTYEGGGGAGAQGAGRRESGV